MRKELKRKFHENQRYKFKATFSKFGIRHFRKFIIITILLTNLVDRTGKLNADHIWMDCGKSFDKLNLREGDKIQFYARTKIYSKGYEGVNEYGEEGFKILDYGLSYPSKAEKLKLPYTIR